MRPYKDVKLKDIANALGISVVSVSNALRGKRGVSDELRKKVCEEAKRLGLDLTVYERQIGEKSETIEQKFTISIAVIVSQRYISIGTSFYWQMYQKTAYIAAGRGCITTLEIADDEHEAVAPLIIRQQEVDGVIVIGPMREPFLKSLLNAAACPVVFMDQQIGYGKYSAVLSGNYYGMYRSTYELVLAGHREIGFVGTLARTGNIIDRYYGYKKCMRENGLKVLKQWVLSDRKGENEIPGIKLPEHLPSAFACSSDYAAAILYDALKERAIRVPEDISIVGYDDYLIGHELSGKLTTYRVDLERMAKCAVKLVLREIQDPMTSGVIYEVDSDVIKRESVRKIV